MILDFTKQISFNDMRQAVRLYFTYSSGSKSFWDLITCMRGPDHPSERPDMIPEDAQIAYVARRARKRETVEVIRGKAFDGCVPGAARARTDINYVTLPPVRERDHFDRHVAETAALLGIEVRVKAARVGKIVKAVVVDTPSPPMNLGAALGIPNPEQGNPLYHLPLPSQWAHYWSPKKNKGKGGVNFCTQKAAEKKGWKLANADLTGPSESPTVIYNWGEKGQECSPAPAHAQEVQQAKAFKYQKDMYTAMTTPKWPTMDTETGGDKGDGS